jgi:hypothetical protein
MKPEFRPEKVLANNLVPLGFTDVEQDGEHVFRRSMSDGEFVQEVVLNARTFDQSISVSITLAITARRILKFVEEHVGSEMAAVATVGGNFAQIRSGGALSGWDLPTNEHGAEEFRKVANEVATIGVEILNRYSSYQSLTELCLKEMHSPGTGPLGMRHVFELPAILYITERTEACRQSVVLAEEKLLKFIKREDLPARMPEHYRFLRAMDGLLGPVT